MMTYVIDCTCTYTLFKDRLYNNNDTALLGTMPNGINNNGLDTPEVAPGSLKIDMNPRNGNPAFNRALFTLPPLGQFGNTRRRYFYGPGIDNFDTALQKNVRLAEAKSLLSDGSLQYFQSRAVLRPRFRRWGHQQRELWPGRECESSPACSIGSQIHFWTIAARRREDATNKPCSTRCGAPANHPYPAIEPLHLVSSH